MTSREASERAVGREPDRGSPVAAPAGSAQLEEYASVQAVADALDVHPDTVYRAIADGRLPSIRIGRAVRIRVADIDLLRQDPAAVARAASAAVTAQRPPRPRAVRGDYARRARGIS